MLIIKQKMSLQQHTNMQNKKTRLTCFLLISFQAKKFTKNLNFYVQKTVLNLLISIVKYYSQNKVLLEKGVLRRIRLSRQRGTVLTLITPPVAQI